MKRSFRRRVSISAIIVSSLFGVSAATGSTPAEKAQAEALFQEGQRLMDAGQYAAACKRFEASNQLETGVGTTLYLADCYEQTGRLASAWALFEETESIAAAQGQAQRQQIARQRAELLYERLPKVSIDASAIAGITDVDLALDESSIPMTALGTPLPIDPGKHVLVVSASQYEPAEVAFEIPEGTVLRRVALPELQRKPVVALPPNAASRPDAQGDALNRDDDARPQPWRTIGIVATVAGGAGLLAAGGLWIHAANRNESSKDYCRADDSTLCTGEGIARRNDAIRFDRAATITAAASAGVLVTGVLLWALAPEATPRPASIALVPELSSEPGVFLEGSF